MAFPLFALSYLTDSLFFFPRLLPVCNMCVCSGVVQLDRPKALNALSEGVVNEILDATKAFDDNPDVGAIVLTGSERTYIVCVGWGGWDGVGGVKSGWRVGECDD